MNIGFIILTRTDSRRLKNKALKFVHKKKRLTDIVFENVLKTFSKEFQIILSTTKRDIDNRLIRHTKKNYKNIKTFRGNYSNVAKRFLKTILAQRDDLSPSSKTTQKPTKIHEI